jgi:5-carboxymethyl-2-hydroxymuconate isomerase
MIDSGLFGTADIKTRATVVKDYVLGASTLNQGDFIHIIIRLLDGRTMAQKQTLTSNMAKTLRVRLPNLTSITVDIIDMVRESYAKDVI